MNLNFSESKFPLPEEIDALGDDEKSCQYCGIPYLLRTEVSKMTAMMKAMESDVHEHSTCKQKLQRLEDDCNSLKIIVKVKESELNETFSLLECERESHRRSIETHCSQQTHAEEKISKFREQFEKSLNIMLQTITHRFESLSRKIDLGTKLVTTTREKLRQRNDTLKTRHAKELHIINMNMERVTKENINLINKMKIMEDELKRVNAENVQHQMRSSQFDSLNDENERLEQQTNRLLESLKSKEDELFATINSHQLQVQDLQDRSNKEKMRYENEIIPNAMAGVRDKYEADIKNLKFEYQKEREEQNELIQDLQSKITNERLVFEVRLQESLSELRSESNQMYKQNQILSETISRQQKEITVLKELVRRECEERDSLTKQIENLRNALPGARK